MNIISKFVILEAAILSASFVVACPALANEQPLKGKLLNNVFQSQPRADRETPKSGFKPLPFSLPMTDAQRQLTQGQQYTVDTSRTGRLGPTGFPISAIGDFPLPKLNFPRENSPRY